MTGFILAPANVGLSSLSSEAQEVLNVLTAAGYRMHLIQQPVTKLELYRALDKGPFEVGWVGTHSNEEGFLLGSETLSPLELGRFLYEAGTKDLVLNVCFSVQHVQAIQSRAEVNIVATINPDGVDDREAWSTALYLARALARTQQLQRAYLQAIAGGFTQYQLFPYLRQEKELDPITFPITEPSPRQKNRGQVTVGMLEERLREKLTEHEVKLALLEVHIATNKTITIEYINELRADIVSIKSDLRPLIGLGLVSPPPSDPNSRMIARSLVFIAIFLAVLSVLLVLLLIYLAVGGIS